MRRTDRSASPLAACAALLLASGLGAAELILPQNRTALFTAEPVEFAVAGLAKGTMASVELVPQKPGAGPVKFAVKGDGSTQTFVLPPRSLAPNVYALKLDGKDVTKLTISTGVPRSTMLVTQVSTRPPEGGANFVLGNAFGYGLLDPKGQPDINPRGKRSGGFSSFENAVAADLPYVVYMYWTGYVLHKPFGDEKSWANAEMNEAMRLLSFATAQRLRRYGPLFRGIGPIDEPGLAWGKTPAGGMASGFPNWDEADWYARRGWKFTPDITDQSEADWMKYLTIRCAIIKENYERAKKDFKAVWPGVTWSGDLYAPHAIMDGTDPLSQQVNDVPASHVFFDFMGGPLSAPGQIYLEKAHDPASKLAHAMNGQLIGTRGPQRPLYHQLMNAMLMAGLHSNWWLNTGGMTKEDLETVNEPAERLGPLFHELAPTGHDVALLWGFTEIGLRAREITAREATKKTGEQIKLLVPLPEKGELKETEINSNAYEVGAVYTTQLLDVHQVLRRAGYPVHFVHERLLAGGVLKNYKTLVIVGQTFELPPAVRKAIDDFVQAGGKVVVDPSTKIKIDGAITFDADFSATALRARTATNERAVKAARSKHDASLFETIDHLNKPHRQAVPALKAAMAKTASRPVFASDDVDLVGERHVGGEGALLMVLNGHEQVPDVPGEQPVPRYNNAPATTAYTLQGVPKGSVVYCVEGIDWRQVSRVEKPDAPQSAKFAAGEMKLYLVAPRAPQGLDLKAAGGNAEVKVEASLKGLKMPWPFTVAVTAADGRELYRAYRATKADGTYAESFPVGRNLKDPALTVRLVSPLADLSVEAKVELKPAAPSPAAQGDTARVFDAATIRKFLAGQPDVVIAVGKDGQRAQAEELARQLGGRGIKAALKPEAEVLKKVAYPRVWDPYARVYKATGEEQKSPQLTVKNEITLSTDEAGVVTATGPDGKPVENWRRPNTLVTIAGQGYLDWQAPHETVYEAGCRLYFDDKNQLKVLKGEKSEAKTTAEFRAKWAKPWQRLQHHVGGFQLPPELPAAYRAESHLILLGDSTTGPAVAALQASEVLPQVADAKYPGPGKALVTFAWSPFAVEKNVILIGASDEEGLKAGVRKLLELVPKK